MSTHISATDIEATKGKLDGVCFTCGSPARRMGWQGDHYRYWRMCTASGLGADDQEYGPCDLPTEAKARQRLRAPTGRWAV